MGLEIGGEWTEDPNRVKGDVRDYFKNLYTRKGEQLIEIPIHLFENRLVAADGELLTTSFSIDEIKQAVWDCDGDKSPGPDRFGMDFYKKCWNIIQEDLLRVFEEFHANGKLVRGCNPSYIALIPKKEGECNLNQLRPVSLIGNLYKILAKTLANRLKQVIGKLINESQTAFIKDRSIFYGAVLLNEAIEDARKSKVKRLFLKLDFSKAFDTISWDYLIDVMTKMGFPSRWVCWIKECLTTANANVLVNGSPSGEFEMTRGIR